MRRSVFAVLAVLFASLASADPPVINGSFQYNSNVSIDFIYSYQSGIGVAAHIHLSNGAFCYVTDADKTLYAAILSMKAQQLSGQFVCEAAASATVDGQDSRRLHRLGH